MPDYMKLKNAELDAMLKERGLATGGKKADMVDRLKEDDEKKATPAAAPKTTVLHPEDEIDWDDDGDLAPPEPTKPAPAAPSVQKTTVVATEPSTIAKAGGAAQPPKPQGAPSNVAATRLANSDDASVDPPVEQKKEDGAVAEAEKELPQDYTKGLAASNIEQEIEKRKARAKKFGMNIDEDETMKMLERAKKFGDSGPPRGLDEALPERNRKRGRDDHDDNGRNKRRGGGKFGYRGGRGNRDRRDNRNNRDNRDNRPAPSGSSWMSEADRAKAEARKSKFAKPAAT